MSNAVNLIIRACSYDPGNRAGPAGIFPYEHTVPPTGMKNVEMRVRRRNYVIDFSNFQLNISINVKFHPD